MEAPVILTQPLHSFELMKVTVCELPDATNELENDWRRLVEHLRQAESDLVLLPEMPFYPWFAQASDDSEQEWQKAVEAHDLWQKRLEELTPARVMGSRPVTINGQRLNEGFVWSSTDGYTPVHHKYYLPDEKWFWEGSWYEQGADHFELCQVQDAEAGFLICTELWAMDRARDYGKKGAHLVVTPRATELATADKWLTGGRVAAISAGAFHLSSNRSGTDKTGEFQFGGQGWISDPDGRVLGKTTSEDPFITKEIDLAIAEKAKTTYPRYVF